MYSTLFSAEDTGTQDCYHPCGPCHPPFLAASRLLTVANAAAKTLWGLRPERPKFKPGPGNSTLVRPWLRINKKGWECGPDELWPEDPKRAQERSFGQRWSWTWTWSCSLEQAGACGARW